LIDYADTSFLFSLFVPDVHSSAAAAKMKLFQPSLFTSDFGEFEFTNAISWRVFRKQFLLSEHQAVIDWFNRDVQTGTIRIVPLPTAAFAHAKQIALNHSPNLGTRALDVLHVASAIVLNADTFYTFDGKQAKLASTLGLRVP
jgi:predicted nucleic acid-binding protein